MAVPRRITTILGCFATRTFKVITQEHILYIDYLRGQGGGAAAAEGLENAMAAAQKGSAAAKSRDRDLKESADRHSTPDRSPDGDTKWQYRCPESALHSSKVKPTFYSVERFSPPGCFAVSSFMILWLPWQNIPTISNRETMTWRWPTGSSLATIRSLAIQNAVSAISEKTDII